MILPLLFSCSSPGVDSADSGSIDELPATPAPVYDAFADEVVSFEPGEGAGYGQDRMPDVVLGPPVGGGTSGSLDVVSFGREGVIVLLLTDFTLIDGEGTDLLVFENPFPGWYELGVVGVSDDGVNFVDWPCDTTNAEAGYPGCAGVQQVWSSPDSGIAGDDVQFAGGDAFDLANIGVSAARYLRIRDAGVNSYDGTSGGFDLDAVAVIHGVP